LHPVVRYRFTLVGMSHREISTVSISDECTLPTEEQPLRVAEFDGLFVSALRRVERRDRTLLVLTFDAGAEVTVRDLVAREAQCCSFFTFAVMAGPGGCHVEVGVPVTHSAVLDGLSARAAYLAGLDT